MPLIRISPTQVTTYCAKCNLERVHEIAILRLGICYGGMKDPNQIELPACMCVYCAQEFLIRTWDTPPEGAEDQGFWRHKKVVNTLARHLKEQGLSHPEVLADHQAEPSNPPVDFGALVGVIEA